MFLYFNTVSLINQVDTRVNYVIRRNGVYTRVSDGTEKNQVNSRFSNDIKEKRGCT